MFWSQTLLQQFLCLFKKSSQHTQPWVYPVQHGHLFNTATLSRSVLAVLGTQDLCFASLLAKLPSLIRLFESLKKKRQEKVKAQTGQQKGNALTSLIRMACS